MDVKKFFLVVSLAGLLLPLFALAGTYQAGGTTVHYQGLVPCGKKVCLNGDYNDKGVCQGEEKEIPCTFCHFFVMLDGIIDFVLYELVPPIAILMLVIGGVMIFLAGFSEWGGPTTYEQGKKLISGVLIGLVVIYSSWLVVNEFLQLIGVASWTGLQGGWFQILCQIPLPN